MSKEKQFYDTHDTMNILTTQMYFNYSNTGYTKAPEKKAYNI